jgi:hypothetical protein
MRTVGRGLSVGALVEMERRANELDIAQQSDDCCLSRNNGLNVLMGLHDVSRDGDV